MEARNPTLNLNISNDCSILPSDLAFYKQWVDCACLTDQDVIASILSIWRRVKEEHHTYRCVQSLAFLVPKVHRLAAYPRIMQVFRENPNAKLADIGCCFGQDIRRLILDGVPPSSIYAIDVTSAYWDAGVHIYRDDTPTNARELSQVHAHFCDLCSSDLSSELTTRLVDGSFDCLILKNVFHVLSSTQADTLVGRMSEMLKVGGLLTGICLGAEKAKDWALTPDGKDIRYLQSKDSLTTMFSRYGFADIHVQVMRLGIVRSEAELRCLPDLDDADKVRIQFTATKQ